MARRRRLTGRALAVLGGSVIAMAAVAAVFADSGALDVEVADRTGYAVDYTNDGAKVEYIGDLNTTFGSSGSGVFDAFVRLQADTQEAGYNTDGDLEFNSKGGAFTHAILVSDIPVVSLGGQPHWELFADINDSDNTKLISLNELEIYFTADRELTGYPFAGTATKVYDFSGSIHINDVNQGSGRGDLRYNVPLSGITIPADCGYKNPACATYFVLYSQWGAASGDYMSDGGFEEWKVKEYPFVVVSKTAATTFTRTFPWTIDKSVTPDAWSLFANESGTSRYTVALTKGTGVDSAWAVSGTIAISNPGTDGAVISSVSDIVSGAGGGAASVSCGVTFPYTLPKNQTLNCTYSRSLPDGTSRTNTATATLDYGGLFTGSAAVTFGSPTTLVNDSVSVTDTVQGSLGSFSASGSTSYDRTFTCDADSGTHNNTATITQTGQNDSASVTVSCYEINVTKDASTSLTRTYSWTIDKTVTPAAWQLFTGESGTSRYTVSVDKTGSTDSAWAVAGNIHVNNPNPIPATINSVSDAISGGITATVSCGVTFPYVLAANSSLDCTYSANLPDGASRTNTATAVRQDHNYTYQGVASNGGATNRTGTAGVSFAAPTVTSINASINVTDTNGSSWGPVSDDATWTYDRTFTCDADSGTHNNTATITQTGQNDSAAVIVSCYEINVTKDAATSYTRTFHWTIDKSSNDPHGGALTLNPGQVYADYPYRITVDLANPAFTDSAWAVAGNIHVNNPNPIPATINGVSDLLATDGAAIVTCGVTFPYTLAANSTLDCTYATSLPGANNQLNTATAVRQNHNYDHLLASTNGGTVSTSGTANVVFGAPTTLVDESIMIVDDYGTPGDTGDDLAFGPVNYTDTLPRTFTYNRTFGPLGADACGEVTIRNTASFTANDTGATGSDSWTVTITIPCPTGCTLTQGYWKTHSLFGPAPEDENWFNIGDVDGDGVSEGPNETFFASGATWYTVFWTTPKGGSAYYILAHQYQAAVLNIASPADAPQSVLDAIAWADAFFTGRNPTANIPKALRTQAIQYAGLLGSYNEGAIGPGHCSEDRFARTAPG